MLEWGKRTFVVIISKHKAKWGNLEIPSLSWFIFSNVFAQDQTGSDCVKNELSQNLNKKKEKSLSLFFSDY